jgi:hypothetical protein
MELQFDIRGNLMPSEIIDIFWDDFKQVFVKSFDDTSTRYKIFEKFEAYIAEFQTEICKSFTLWVNGSFVSRKINPNDIDVVILLEYQIQEQFESLIRSKFTAIKTWKTTQVDAYILKLFPENHQMFKATTFDKYYWVDKFSNSKMNKEGKSFSKGFIQIKIS